VISIVYDYQIFLAQQYGGISVRVRPVLGYVRCVSRPRGLECHVGDSGGDSRRMARRSGTRGTEARAASHKAFSVLLPGFKWVTSDAPGDVAGTRYARAPRRQGAFDPEFIGRSELVAP
jgi:hypothetical protein